MLHVAPGAYMESSPTVTLGWLHEEEGMQRFVREGDVLSVLILWLQYLQFEFSGLSLEVHMEDWVYHQCISELWSFHLRVFAEYDRIVTFQLVPHRVLRALLGLLEAMPLRVPVTELLAHEAQCKKGLGFRV